MKTPDTNQATRQAIELPEELPHGESVVWQGKPSWRSLAFRAFHVRKIGIYFSVILIFRSALGLYTQLPVQTIASNAIPILAFGLGAMVIATLLAWLYSRTTTYTITNRRIFMKFGAALPMMLNVPFGIIGAAGAKVHRDGTADIPLQLTGTGRVAYLHLWPHARPWQLKFPQPMLRSLPDGAHVASLLAAALASAPSPAEQAMTMHEVVNATDNCTNVLTPAAA